LGGGTRLEGVNLVSKALNISQSERFNKEPVSRACCIARGTEVRGLRCCRIRFHPLKRLAAFQPASDCSTVGSWYLTHHQNRGFVRDILAGRGVAV
jgi:hypothetical protein